MLAGAKFVLARLPTPLVWLPCPHNFLQPFSPFFSFKKSEWWWVGGLGWGWGWGWGMGVGVWGVGGVGLLWFVCVCGGGEGAWEGCGDWVGWGR